MPAMGKASIVVSNLPLRDVLDKYSYSEIHFFLILVFLPPIDCIFFFLNK